MPQLRKFGPLVLMLIGALVFAQETPVTPQLGQQQNPAQPGQQNPTQPGQQNPAQPGTQDQDKDKQKPTDVTSPIINEDEPSRDRQPGDTFAVSSIEPASVGRHSLRPRYVNAKLSFSESVDTNPMYTGTMNGNEYTSMVSGELSLQRRTRFAAFTLDYSGGGLVHKENSSLDSSFHQVVTDASWGNRHLRFAVRDVANYSPESPFGFVGLGNNFTSQLGSQFLPDQTILTTRNRRLSNTAAGEMEYRMSAHTSLTFSGNYGLMRFFDIGLVDSDQYGGALGFNKELGRRDVIGVKYQYSFYKFLNQGTQTEAHAWSLLYRHRIGQRFTVTLGAGPQLVLLGGLGSLGRAGVGVNPTLYQYNATGSVDYVRRNTSFSISASHGTTAGSGVLQGAETTSVSGFAQRTLHRGWTVNVGGGYARNDILAGQIPGSFGMYNTEYGSAGISHTLGRHASVFFNYNVQQQDVPVVNCTGSACSNRLRHIFTFGFDWHYRDGLD